jgi:SAM-dependent methyltransferase
MLEKLLQEIITNNSLIQLQLNSPREKIETIPKKMVLTPWKDSAGLLKYKMTSFFPKKSIDKHLTADEVVSTVTTLLASEFKQALIYTKQADYQILISKKGKVTILKKKPTKAEQSLLLDHNRSKNYLLPEGEPVPFLVALGVMNEDGKVRPSMYDKFKQINRYLETVADLLPVLTKEPLQRPLQVIDFGCGKSYLTFALYHYLVHQLKIPTRIIGLDLKSDVIERCRALAVEFDFHQLQFMVGDIGHYQFEGPVDMVISLHACDTATDKALEKAVQWHARVILAVPCCQHALLHQIDIPALQPLLKHGILRERFAAMATDALRAQWLETQGYHATIVEFIDMEHTPKNILIRAILQKDKTTTNKIEEYRQFQRTLTG